MNNQDKPVLKDLLDKWEEAKAIFQERLHNTGPGESVGTDPSLVIYRQIEEHYPAYFKNLEEYAIQNAVQLLKSKGYKILKPETKTEYHEV